MIDKISKRIYQFSVKLRPLVNWNSVWMLAYFIGIGIFLVVTPKYNDDHWFLWEMGDWFIDRDVFYITDGVNPFAKGMPWQEIFDTIIYRYNCDNARLGNMLVMPFLILPKWVGSSICWLSWICSVMMALKMGGIDWKKSPLIPVAVALWYFGMPWQNHMGGLVFEFNYLIPSLIAMFLLSRLVISQKEYAPGKLILIIPVSIILGAWHEGIALPFAAGIASVMICCRKSRNVMNCVVVAGLITGVLFIICAPSFQARTSHLDLYYMASVWDAVKRLGKITLYYHPLILVLLVLEIAVGLKRGFRMLFGNKMILFLTASAIASVFVSFATTGSERSGWWCDMIVPMGILMLLQEVYFFSWQRDRRKYMVCTAFCILSGIISIFSLVLTDIYTFRNDRECRKVVAEYVSSGKNQIYNDWMVNFDGYLAWFTKIDRYFRGWEGLLPPSYNNKHGLKNEDGYIRIVPDAMRNITPAKGTVVSGDGNVKEINGLYFMRSADIKADHKIWNGNLFYAETIDFTNTIKKDVEVVLIPFISECDTTEYVYLKIHKRELEQAIGQVRAIGKIKGKR